MPLKVLIVEDNPAERRSLRAFVQRLPALAIYDMQIAEAGDGEEALEAARDELPDLVLVDLLLPKLDGIALCQRLRTLPEGAHVQLIANSGVYRDAQVAKQLTALGATFLSKPIDHKALARAILSALAAVKGADAERVRGWLRRGRPTRRSAGLPRLGGAAATGEVPIGDLSGDAPSDAPSGPPPAVDAPKPTEEGGALAPRATGALSFSQAQRGRLEEHPPAALLAQAAEEKATGELELTHGKVRKVVFLRDGAPIFVDSNLRNETLGAYLVSQGNLDESQLTQAMRQARASKKKLGETLVSLGLVDEATVEAGLRAQTRIKIVSALRWLDGHFEYQPGRAFVGKVPSCPVQSVPLILAALSRFASGTDLRARLSEQLDQGFCLTPLGKANLDSILKVFGAELLAEDTDRLPLRQLMDRADDGAALLVQVEALRCSGLATLAPLEAAEEPATEEHTPAPPPPQGMPPLAAAPDAGAMPPLTSSPMGGGAMPPLASPPTGEGAMPPLAGQPSAGGGMPPLAHAGGASQVSRIEELPGAGRRPQPPLKKRPSASLPRFALGLTKSTAAPDGSQLIELELEGGASAEEPAPPVLELRDLDPTRSTDNLPMLVDLELEQPGATSPRWVDQDSGVLEIPSTEGLELEEPDGLPTALERDTPPAESPRAEAGDEEVDDELETADPLGLLMRSVKAGIDRAHQLPPPSPQAPQGEDLSSDPSQAAAVDAALADVSVGSLASEQPQAGATGSFLSPLRQHDYEQRLASADPVEEPSVTDTFGAELYFQEGEGLMRANDLEGAVTAFTSAVEANPVQPDYHGMLGWALFLKRGRGVAGAMAARPHFQRALDIAPESVRVHELAGRVEEDVHDYVAAASHLGKALRYGPPRMDLFGAIKDMLARTGNYGRLEQHYRDMILRLREHDPQRTVPLWIDLAHLYHERLEQPQNAELALQVAAKLAPDDPRLKAARSAIAAAEPVAPPSAGAGWEGIAEGHRQRWQSQRQEPAPLHQLAALHRRGGRRDLVLIVGSVLLSRGEASLEERQEVERLRPSGVVKAPEPLSEETLARLAHDSDDERTERVLAELAGPLARHFPLGDRIGLDREARSPSSLPGPLADALRYAAEQLSVELPPIYQAHKLVTLAPLPGPEAGLVFGPPLLEVSDPRRLIFAAGQALSCIGPGRREVFLRRGSELKLAFMGALKSARPTVPVADPDGRAAVFARALDSDESRVSRLRGLLAELFGGGGKFNLSEWMRGVRRTAGRVGLVLATDLVAAMEELVNEALLRDDLADFALDPFYAQLRRDRSVALP